mmetsp:Transcript_34403/g.70280  ORF Transcript_34403/g.70280 Transcript_34403/m.70280 type:complete len:95 (+) Transcript_34403:114-398(+)
MGFFTFGRAGKIQYAKPDTPPVFGKWGDRVFFFIASFISVFLIFAVCGAGSFVTIAWWWLLPLYGVLIFLSEAYHSKQRKNTVEVKQGLGNKMT